MEHRASSHDSEWAERLSAYFDGELAPDEMRELEAQLKADPALAARLEAMKATSRLLAEWAPEDPELPVFVERRAARAGAVVRRRMFWPAACAACFASGVLIGAIGFFALRVRTQPATSAHVVIQMARPEEAISPAIADELLRETSASALREQLATKVRDRDWSSALDLYERLQRDFNDTRTAREAARDLSATDLARRASQGRRT